MRNLRILFFGFLYLGSASVFADDAETLRAKSKVQWTAESDETYKAGIAFGVGSDSEIIRLGLESPSFLSAKNEYFKGIYDGYFDVRFVRIKNLVDANSGILIQSFNILFGLGLLTRAYFKEDQAMFFKLGFELIHPDSKIVTLPNYWGARIEVGYERFLKNIFWFKEIKQSVYTSASYDYNNITADNIINSPTHFNTIALNLGFNFEY